MKRNLCCSLYELAIVPALRVVMYNDLKVARTNSLEA